MKRILLAMSGGVDSSTAAVLLKNQGFELVGCTMQLWDYRRSAPSEGEARPGRCCSLEDVYDARRVAELLDFPFYVLNLEEPFQRKVIEPFIENYLTGRTPSPCILCNTFLKFDRLLGFARRIGVDRVATGHYARVHYDRREGYKLLRGRDPVKDQSYFLFELNQEQLAHILFPVGDYGKDNIREIARSSGLATASKHDSQEICFVPDGDYAGFIGRHAEEINPGLRSLLESRRRPGPILFKDGTLLGTHPGIHHFTVGQRRGLKIAHRRPLYVMRLDPARNAVIVGYQEDVYSDRLLVERVSWVSGRQPDEPLEAEVRIRSRHREAPGTIEVLENGTQGISLAEVLFREPQLSVTPGQAAVFYRGEEVLGGGWIRSA